MTDHAADRERRRWVQRSHIEVFDEKHYMKDTPGLTMDESETKMDQPSADKNRQRGQGSDMGFALPNAIGDRLKAYYNDVASEPVPDRFLSLLEQLDHAENKKRSTDGEDVE